MSLYPDSSDVDVWLRIKAKARQISAKSLMIFSLFGVLLMLYEIGFKHSYSTLMLISDVYDTIALFLVIFLLLKAILEFRWKLAEVLKRLPEYIILLILFLSVDARLILTSIFPQNSLLIQALASNQLIYILFLLLFLVEVSKSSIDVLKVSLNPALLFVLSFLFIIIIGAGLLLLPNATPAGISFVDALFTSTSAVCVTGLIVVDTATDFTFLGQLIILILIQIGGLGIMTFTSFFGFFFKGNTTYQSQILLKDIVNEENLSEIFRTLVKIIIFTLTIELVGALIIFSSISQNSFDNTFQRIWFSIFHSISGFCNAGFSTLTNSLYQTGFRTNYNLHLIIAILIVVGGLGFPIIFNYGKYIKSVFYRYVRKIYHGAPYIHLPRILNVNTKIVVYTTISLLVLGFIAFYFSEVGNTLQGKSLYGKIVTVIFGAVTPRTAGFNTIDMTAITLPTILIYLFLMWIGASPGSTGGGIKTSTFALAILNTLSIAKGKDRVEIFSREIHSESIRRALSIILLSFMVIGMAIFLISIFNPSLNLIDIIFECFSAYSTVGLSLGITSSLSSASKLVIVCTMFIGRVGSLTILVALIRKVRNLSYRYPGESIFIN